MLFGQKRAEGLHWGVILVGCAVAGKRTKKLNRDILKHLGNLLLASNVDIKKVSKRFQK